MEIENIILSEVTSALKDKNRFDLPYTWILAFKLSICVLLSEYSHGYVSSEGPGGKRGSIKH